MTEATKNSTMDNSSNVKRNFKARLFEMLYRQKPELIKVSIYEFDEAKYTKLVREEGRLEGFSEGEDSMAKLAEFLLSENRLEDFKEALADKEKRTRLFQEAGIKR